MSMRSDLFRRLNGEDTEHIPWFGDLSYYLSSLRLRGLLPGRYEGPEGEVRFYRDRKVGICFYAPFTFRETYTDGIEYRERTAPEGIYACFHTKHGDLTSFQKYLPDTYVYAYREHFVKGIDDLERMAYIFEHTRYLPDYEPWRERDRLYGEDGIAVELAPISVSPLQKLLARWAGVETTVSILSEEEDRFEDCLHRIEEAQMPVFEILAGSGAPLIEFPENLTSEVSGSFFRKYNLPYYQRTTERMHRAGKKVSIHIDGTLRPCLSMLREAGFDIAEAVTPAPVGDLDVEELRSVAGEDLVLWGGLPGAMFTPYFSDEEFEAQIRRVLALRDPRTILGVADQVPPDAVEDRIRRVSEIIGRG